MELFFAILAVVGLFILVWYLVRPSRVPAPAARPRSTLEACPACSAVLAPRDHTCPSCRLDLATATARELLDLQATRRQISRWRKAGTLADDLAASLLQHCDHRRAELLGQPVPVPDLLAACRDPRSLSEADARRVLHWHTTGSPRDVSSLPASAQLTLARLLRRHRRSADALGLLHSLATRSDFPDRLQAALEGGELALDRGDLDTAHTLLQAVLISGTSIQARHARELLDKAAELAALPEALPAEPPPVAVQPVAEALAAAPVVATPPAPAARETPVRRPAPIAAPSPPATPRPPRRSLGQVLAAFMEDKNILWGEIVGGLLIVGCSIALVISLWQTLEKIQYAPFLIFAAITAALFGAGLYTLHRWKLDSTSRGLLVIALLLVPLNFVVLARVARGDGGLLPWAVAGVSLAAFAALVGKAAVVVDPRQRWHQTAALLGPSAALPVLAALLAGRDVGLPGLLGLAALVLAAPLAACAAALARALREDPLSPPRARDLLTLLGFASFALATGLGFLCYRAAPLPDLRPALALPVALAALPAVAIGALVWRRLPVGPEAPLAPPGEPEPRPGAVLRTLASGVAFAGGLVLLAALGLAWDRPPMLLAVALLDFALLTLLALQGRLAPAHVPALACLTLAALAGAFLATSPHVPDDLVAPFWHWIPTPAGGTVLSGVVLLTLALAEGFVRLGRRDDAAWYAGTAAALALPSLALVSLPLDTAPARPAAVWCLFSLAAFAANLRLARTELAHLALLLLVGATAWTLRAVWPDPQPAWALVLAGEALALALASFALKLTQPAASPTMGWRAALPWRSPADVAAFTGLGTAAAAVLVPAFPAAPAHAATVFLLAAAAGVLAWQYRAAALSWLASALALLGVLHLLIYSFHQPFPLAPFTHATTATLALAMLVHATALLPLAALFHRAPSPDADRLLGLPLGQSALLTSALAAPCLLISLTLLTSGALALDALWIALLWLALAAALRRPALLAAGQAALAGAALLGVTWALHSRPWVDGDPAGLLDPRSLHAYGLALAGLSLAWLFARLAVRRAPNVHAFLDSPRPTVDRLLLAFVLLAQLALAAWSVLPGVVQELTPASHLEPPLLWSSLAQHSWSPDAWALLAAVAVPLALALAERPTAALLGLLLAALTVPVLLAGPCASSLATASALRHGLALAFLLLSVLIWTRAALARFLPAADAAPWSRRLLVALAVLPVLVLTLLVARLGFLGEHSTGPDPASLFGRMGTLASNLLPLLLLVVGLTGHACRDRLPGWSFAAGLLLSLTLTGGYLLATVQRGDPIDATAAATALQLGVATAAAWALAWVLGRRAGPALAALRKGQPWPPAWAAAWHTGPDAPRARNYLTLLAALLVLGLYGLILPALGLLIGPVPDLPRPSLTPGYAPTEPWTAAVGTPLGWLAVSLGIAALATAAYRPRLAAADDSTTVSLPALNLGFTGLRGSQTSHVLGLCGLVVLSLLACTVAAHAPAWGYRTLMLGLALAMLAWVASLTAAALLHARDGAPSSDARTAAAGAAGWIALAGLLVLALALKAAFLHEDRAWASLALGLAALAGAGLAVARRQEEVAFFAGLGLNLAASLAVWHLHLAGLLSSLLLWQVVANGLAFAVVALLWLAWRRAWFGPPARRVARVPLLSAQVALALACCAFLVFWPFAHLTLVPGWPLPSSLAGLGDGPGWFVLVFSALAAFLHLARGGPRWLTTATGLTSLAAVVLAACFVNRWDTPGSWLSFHAMLLGMSAVALAFPVLGVIGAARLWSSDPSADTALSPTGPAPVPASLLDRLGDIFTLDRVRRWATGTGVLVVILALRGVFGDPGQPWWSAQALLAVTASCVALALLFRRALYVYLSGLVLALLGLVLWDAWYTPGGLSSLLAVETLCLAGAAVFWTAAELILAAHVPHLRVRGWTLPFRSFAVAIALLLVAVLAGDALLSRYAGQTPHHLGLSWLAWAGALSATAAGAADRRSRLALPTLYLGGLLGVVLVLASQSADPDHLNRFAALLLGGFVLLSALTAWALRHVPAPAGPDAPADPWGLRHGTPWWLPAQAMLTGLVVVLAAATVLSLPTRAERLAAPASVALAALAGLVPLRRLARAPVRQAILGLGAVALVLLGWSLLDPALPALWLHRNVVLMTALAACALAYGAVLPRLARLAPAWAYSGRRFGPACGVLAVAAMLVVLAQELLLYDRTPGVGRTPLTAWATAVVLVALVGLIAALLHFAVQPGRDPFALTERGRTAYVYLAELLLFGLFLHTRLTIPWLFSGRLVQYWTFLVMAVAFGTVALAELFRRRGLPVLAIPLHRTGLLLPLIPLAVFWLRPPTALQDWLIDRAPGTETVIQALNALPNYHTQPSQFDRYALLWFLFSGVLALVAAARRQGSFALASVLTANLGLWCLLHHSGWSFVAHPQVWLVPLALIVLAAEYLNRPQLGDPAASVLRYAGMALLYLSSTADLILSNLSPSMALVLAVLSVLGVLAGILLRVRAFLFLGTGFLGLTVLAMVWRAGREGHMWVWWAAGIVLGLAILGLFALFEKRKNDVLQVVQHLRHWQ